MENQLYYEVPVTLASEIKTAYEHVVKNNIRRYRCLAKDGNIYGWVNEKHVKAQVGQEWFDNPEYKENLSAVNENSTKEHDEEVDYKALYEETKRLLLEAEDKAANYLKAYTETKWELDEIKDAFFTLAKEFNSAKNKLEE